jgi:hypothetical protein
VWYWLGPVIAVAVIGIVIYAIVRMGREDVELEPGGSWGDQLGGKKSDDQS